MSRTVDPTEIRDTTDRLAHQLEHLDLGSCLPATLAELVTLGERIERLGHGLKTRAAARVAASAVWQGDGDRTAEDWLARQTGTSKADAGRLVETGRQLEALPTVAGAVTRGECPRGRPRPSPARRPRTRGPSGGCCPTAKDGSLRELQDECRRTRVNAESDPEAAHRRAHAKRSCRVWTDADGVTGHLQLSGPVAEVARVDNAIRHRADRLFRQARAEGRRNPRRPTPTTPPPSSDLSGMASRPRGCRRQDHRPHRPHRPHPGPCHRG